MTTANMIYLIGSLRNKRIPQLGTMIRNKLPALEVFDDWFAAGEEADDKWKEYEEHRGRSYTEALRGYAARNVFDFDRRNLDRCSHALLVLPAGKSGHMEIMYAKYSVGAEAAILLEPDADPRWDVMYQFVDRVLETEEEVIEWLRPSMNKSLVGTTRTGRSSLLSLSPQTG